MNEYAKSWLAWLSSQSDDYLLKLKTDCNEIMSYEYSSRTRYIDATLLRSMIDRVLNYRVKEASK